MMNSNSKILTLLIIIFSALVSCTGAEESDIAKNIKISMSSAILVLPTDLENTDEVTQTCVADGVTGPRIRFRVKLAWLGTDNLLPISAVLSFTDSRFKDSYESVLSASAAGYESFSPIFADSNGDPITTDYIPGPSIVTTKACFFDYGGLPSPTEKLTGGRTIDVPFTLTLMGITRDADGGNEKPWVKEAQGELTYMAGSVPIGD